MHPSGWECSPLGYSNSVHTAPPALTSTAMSPQSSSPAAWHLAWGCGDYTARGLSLEPRQHSHRRPAGESGAHYCHHLRTCSSRGAMCVPVHCHYVCVCVCVCVCLQVWGKGDIVLGHFICRIFWTGHSLVFNEDKEKLFCIIWMRKCKQLDFTVRTDENL